MRHLKVLTILATLASSTADADPMDRVDGMQAVFAGSAFEADRQTLAWAVTTDHDGPFHMVNLLEFRDTADYGADSSEIVSGLEAQRRYGSALRPVVEELGIRSVLRNSVVGTVIALDGSEYWQMITVVCYPSPLAMVRLVEDPRYQAAIVHKQAALRRTRAIVTLPSATEGPLGCSDPK